MQFREQVVPGHQLPSSKTGSTAVPILPNNPNASERHSEAEIGLPYAAPPAPGDIKEIASGILWARIPLPFRLNHVNVWLLEEANGWTVIDSGLHTDEAKQVWETLLSETLVGKPLVRMIATHGHIDHIGLAGWLVDRFNMPFVASLTEWLAARMWRTNTLAASHPTDDRFFALHGCDAPAIEAFGSSSFRKPDNVYPLPDQLIRLRAEDVVHIGKRDWRVIVSGGHADEHTALYCEADRLLIAGDQILQRISPVVGVWSGQPFADPLSEYLISLERFRKLPDNVFVLPSHGLPFYGLHRRLSELAAHHMARLDKLDLALMQPCTGMDAATALFPQAVREDVGGLTLAETLAHLHYLITIGRARRQTVRDRLVFHRIEVRQPQHERYSACNFGALAEEAAPRKSY
jgi:glyoxylase-like metal-dependent hydrolase (beta-lactamase superfamily II)